MEEEQLIAERRRKLDELRAKGIEPYPYRFSPTHHAADLQQKYAGLKAEERTQDGAVVAGRLMALRRMGKATFAKLLDGTGAIQLHFREDILGQAAYDILRLYDLGDFIGAQGVVFRTKMGELTVEVKEATMLSKALRPLPEKFHGLQDTEARYRRRYLDLVMNPEVREVFRKRAIIIKTIREVLERHGYLEVETPVLQPIYGGAHARPFVTRHNALDRQLYLRISNELYLKRLVAGGFERVYEIVKDFRNEGLDRTHQPEFTQVEWYGAYGDYHDGMAMYEELFEAIAKRLAGGTAIDYQGTALDFARPWRRVTRADAIKAATGLDVLTMDEHALKAYAAKQQIDLKGADSKGLMIQHIFEAAAEPKLVQPTFLLDHPIETTPLCKPLRGGPRTFVERFEPYAFGWELGNAYSELNDPVLQRELLEKQAVRRAKGDEEAHPMDEGFLQAVEYGMPPMTGNGLGVDRVVMLFTNQKTIRDVILFPVLREERGEQ